MRPRKRRVQSNPLNDAAPKHRPRCQRFLSHHSAKRIRQMAHHLVRRHFPPPPLAVRPPPPHAFSDLILALPVRQRLHAASLLRHSPDFALACHRKLNKALQAMKRFCLTYSYMGMYSLLMARASTTSDAFNAVAEPRRRDILNYLALQE